VAEFQHFVFAREQPRSLAMSSRSKIRGKNYFGKNNQSTEKGSFDDDSGLLV
jgi:hypothetical protein